MEDEQVRTTPAGVKHSTREILRPLLPISLYSAPAFYVAARGNQLSSTRMLLVLVVLLFSAAWFWCWRPQSGLRAQASSDRPTLNLSDIDHSDHAELLREGYLEVSEEARYRDRLLIHTGYFSLGVFGLLGGVFVTSPEFARPVVAMVASLILLGFVAAANAYKDSRDALWDRQGRLERTVAQFDGRFTTFSTIRQLRRRFFNKLSLSAYLLTLTTFLFFVSALIYYLSLFFTSPPLAS